MYKQEKCFVSFIVQHQHTHYDSNQRSRGAGRSLHSKTETADHDDMLHIYSEGLKVKVACVTP